MRFNHSVRSRGHAGFAAGLVLALALFAPSASADETCNSPYMAKIVGQEDYVYVWTLGIPGLGDEQDKLVTIDVNPASERYGTIVHTLSVGGRNEAHHSGLSDDRRYLWAGGLDTSKIFIFDIATDPAKAASAQDHHRFRRQDGRRGRPAHDLRPARAHARHRALQPRGPRRRDGDGRVHQRGRVRRDLLDAEGRRPAGCGQEPASSPTASATTCARCHASTRWSAPRSRAGTTT